MATFAPLREGVMVTFPSRYRLSPGEKPDRIRGVRAPGMFNPRTSRAHQLVPYLQLTRPDSDWV